MSTLSTRIRHTHDTESNWKRCEEFIPYSGEMIVYDVDNNYSYERIKIGDGITKLNDLPFLIDVTVEKMFGAVSGTILLDAGRVTSYND